MLNSAILRGQVFHRRLAPTQHHFRYPTAQWWLALDELEQVNQQSVLLSTNKFAPLWFRRKDYLSGTHGDLATAVRKKMSDLAHRPLSGRVFFLGNLRTFGLYFSPINCYFLKPDGSDKYSHMLAEVSNTPWNERHYYLLDLSKPLQHQKEFHVSPFNPIDMQYKWRLIPPTMCAGNKSLVHLEAWRGSKHFIASMRLKRREMNPAAIRSVLVRYPINTLTTVAAIYWQALKLWWKKTPIYDHPFKGTTAQRKYSKHD